MTQWASEAGASRITILGCRRAAQLAAAVTAWSPENGFVDVATAAAAAGIEQGPTGGATNPPAVPNLAYGC